MAEKEQDTVVLFTKGELDEKDESPFGLIDSSLEDNNLLLDEGETIAVVEAHQVLTLAAKDIRALSD